jgi:PAS domain S-box-containing protein
MAKFIEELKVLHIELQHQNEELRESGKRLEESQAQYAELFHSAPVGYVTLDSQGIIIQANQTAGRMLDVPMARLEGRRFSKFIDASDHPNYFSLIRQYIEGKTSRQSAELRMLKNSAVPFDVEIKVGTFVARDKQFEGWRVIFWDISERKRAGKALQQSEDVYRSIFKAARDAIIITDTDTGQIMDVNDYACEMYGYSYKEMLDLKLFELSAEQAETLRAATVELSWIPVRYHRSKDGAIFPVEISASYLTFGEHRLSTSVIRDISKRLRKERALQKSEENLRYLSARLLSIQEKERQTLAKELHDEVTTPLSAIKYYAENLFDQSDIKERDDARETKFKRMIHIIQDTMEASQRLMTNLRPSVLDDFGLIATIKWLCRQLRKGYEELEINLEVEVQESEVPQNLKSTLFRIAREAIENAARHSRAKHLKIALSSIGGRLQLTIEDDGIGFDHSPSDIYGEGFGILSMKERAELAGGLFSLETAIGRGTTVLVSWPLHPSPGSL